MNEYEGIPHYTVMCSAVCNALYSSMQQDVVVYAMEHAESAPEFDQNINAALSASKRLDEIVTSRA